MKKLILLLTIILSISFTANAAFDTFYNELDDDTKADIMQDLENNSYGTLDEMQQAMYDAALLRYINCCTDLDTLYIKLEQENIAGDILGYTKEDDLYMFVDEDELEKRIIKTLPADSLAAFKTNATTQFVLCVLGNCPYYYIKNVLCEYNDVLGIDLSEFLELYENEEYKVLKKLEYRGYANAEQLQARLNTAVAEVKKASVTPTVGGGGGSGGIVIESTVALGLDVKSLSEQIVPNNEFDVIVYADYENPSIQLYEIGINFDNQYFELKDVSADASGGYLSSKVIDNESGAVDFACYMGDKILVENEYSGKYIIATLTFETLKNVDKNLTFEIDKTRTTLLDANVEKKDYYHNNLDIQIPSAPCVLGGVPLLPLAGDKLNLYTDTADADIYYTTDANKEPDIKYDGSITITATIDVYYVIAKKYGISSAKATIKLKNDTPDINGWVGYIDKYGNSITIQKIDIANTDEDDVIININTISILDPTSYAFVAVYDNEGRMKDIYSSKYASNIQLTSKYYADGYIKFFVVSDYEKLEPLYFTKAPMTFHKKPSP